MQVRHLTIALVGFGSVGRALARLLYDRSDRLRDRERLEFAVTGVATRRHGLAIDRLGLDLESILSIDPSSSLDALHCCPYVADTLEFIREAQADVVVETTLLDVDTGGAAADHVRAAFETGAHVVTANKGPVACAYRELCAMAERHQRQFRFEGTVMDGAPVFNLVADTLPGCDVVGFRGVLNSTTNLLLSRMEQGSSLETALAEAQAHGIVEANPEHDIDGLDAAAKTAALVNVVMGGTVVPRAIPTTGIRGLFPDRLRAEVARGRRMRLVARARRLGTGVEAEVRPASLPERDPLARLTGTSNAITFETDLMGELTIVEHDPGIEQTAYALLADLIAIGRVQPR